MTDRLQPGLADALARWQANYWDRPLGRDTCAAMAAKYEAVAVAVALAPGPAQDLALRAAAARWPGCLRESQLAGPTLCEARRAQALAGSACAAQKRAAWRAADRAAVALWADLHGLLVDVQTWRRAGGAGGPAGFVEFVKVSPAAARWPAELALLVRIGGPQVRSRMVYAWLAAQAGIGLPALNLHLFGRTGPWDSRAGDPPPLP